MTKEVGLESYTNEINLEKKEKKMQDSNIIPFKEYNDSLNQFKKYICRLVINNNIYGTGFLLKLKKGKSPFYCLLTCEHIITDEIIEKQTEITIKYDYFSNNKEYIIKLDEENRFIRTYNYLGIDATIVQIFPNKNEISEDFFFENNKIDFLVEYNYKELEKKNIHIFQFPGEGNTLSYSTGTYLEIYNINGFIHKASTDKGSSGSPILYFYQNSFIVFGIHKGSLEVKKYMEKEETEFNIGGYANIGNFIYPIIDSLRKDTLYFAKSIIFTGEIFENIQKGELLILNDQTKKYDKIYVGDLSHYKPQGKGIMYKINYDLTKEKLSKVTKKKLKELISKIYCGGFNNGEYYGNGILFYNHEKTTFYKGEFKDNLRNGKGKYYENNKLVYDGEFVNDQYDGKGKLYYESGSSYEGEFTKGIKNGKGKEIDSYGNIVVEEKYENNQSLSIKNINKIDKHWNELLNIGKEVLNIFDCEPDYICENCGCSTKYHSLIGNNIWECKNCSKKCKNSIIDYLK